MDHEPAVDDVQEDRLARDQVDRVGHERVVAGDQVDLARARRTRPGTIGGRRRGPAAGLATGRGEQTTTARTAPREPAAVDGSAWDHARQSRAARVRDDRETRLTARFTGRGTVRRIPRPGAGRGPA